MSVTNLSPSVNTREFDLTNTVPAVGASGGAFVGQFAWGPVEKLTDISSENELVAQFYKPDDSNFVDFFSVASFLAYTGNVKLVRVVSEDGPGGAQGAKNATDDDNGLLVKNETHYEIVKDGTESNGVKFAAKYPGTLGNSIRISVADSATFSTWQYKNLFDFAPGTSDSAVAVGAKNDELHVAVIDADGVFSGVPGSVLETYPFVSKALDAKDANNAPNYYVNVISRNSKYVWGFEPLDGAVLVSGAKVASVTVTDGGTGYTSVPTVAFTTAPTGGITATGYAVVDAGEIVEVIITNPGSGYTVAPTVTFTGGGGSDATATSTLGSAGTVNWGTTLRVGPLSSNYKDLAAPTVVSAVGAPVETDTFFNLGGGTNGDSVEDEDIIRGLDLFENAEEVDVSLLFLGDSGGAQNHRQVTQFAIDNLAERRKDLIVFFSPTLNDVLNKTQSDAANNCVARRNDVARSSSYAVMDSGWKLMYDVYNDKFRWIPLNADIAGLCAQVDSTNDPWWSPGGYNRGRLKNVVSLAFNPNKQSRDTLYKIGINPVVTFNVDGTVLYGDKTLQGKQSAFSYIGIRRLFILLRKAIANAAKYFLFEFNDEFTRAQFRAMVEPYLREIRARRGMNDFKVVCDESNNTPEVIMRGEFIGSIFIKPQYSIQYITLNFVAVRRDVAFEEVAGAI